MEDELAIVGRCPFCGGGITANEMYLYGIHLGAASKGCGQELPPDLDQEDDE